jgi:septum formation protein
MLVLASASPRRREILQNAGIAFAVQAGDILEAPLPGETPHACAERLAGEKAAAISRLRPADWILGADTVVAVGGLILGKPADRADAARMLRLLSGRTHLVITGVCLARGGDPVPGPQLPALSFVRSETTVVTMENIREEEIQGYASSDEPMDKAGAYAIQGRASRWISRIEGDYFNVVGLPVSLVYRMLLEQKLV